MRTDVFYMKPWSGEGENPNYIKEFGARVLDRGEKDGKPFAILDRSAFYPEGGGQPSDTGTMRWEGGQTRVLRVEKKGDILHFVDKVPEKDDVTCALDWERRHAHMRMHTAQHIISGAVFDMYGARTVGNQIHAETSRVDFRPANFTQGDMVRIEKACNEVVSRNAVVRLYEEARESLEKRVNEQRCNLDLLPESVRMLRIVEVEGFDVCPCAGTHVKNTSEIGALRLLSRENKGRETERIVYRLELKQ